jgi:hypothetical protein
MGFNVLKNWHPMIGADPHDLMPPGSPSITGKAPYFCVSILMGTGVTAKWGPSTESHYGWTMQRTTDIGPLIPHFGAPNLLLPLIWLFSGSKSYFGSTQVLSEGKPVAVAVAKTINMNLNCAGPTKWPPWPWNVVMAFTTHEAEFTKGDFWAGLAQMAVDSAVQFGLARLFNLGPITRWTTSIYERFLFGPIVNRLFPAMGSNFAATFLFKHHFQEFMLKGIAIQLPLHIAGLLLGTPVGYSPGFAPVGSGLYGMEDKGHDALRDWINGVPNQHPSAPPPGSATPTPAADGAPASSGQGGAPPSGEGGGGGAGGGGTGGGGDAGGQ